MHHDVREVPSDAALAVAGADVLTDTVRRVLTVRDHVTIAVSGGATPARTWRVWADRDLPWPRVTLYQVDERVAPDASAARNRTSLDDALGATAVTVVGMDVSDPDLTRAAAAYAARLPERFDLVHLGLGVDGHTASLLPGDPVLDERDRLVAVTAPYQGYRRLTMTYPALARADQLLWLVAGADKAPALAQLRDGSTAIPAGRVQARASLIVATTAALAA